MLAPTCWGWTHFLCLHRSTYTYLLERSPYCLGCVPASLLGCNCQRVGFVHYSFFYPQHTAWARSRPLIVIIEWVSNHEAVAIGSHPLPGIISSFHTAGLQERKIRHERVAGLVPQSASDTCARWPLSECLQLPEKAQEMASHQMWEHLCEVCPQPSGT